RTIDLSVGSMLGAVCMAIAVLQAEILPDILGFGHPAIWLIAIGAALVLGGLIGLLQGLIVAYVGVPSFIVTLGGLLVWRGVTWWISSGRSGALIVSSSHLPGGRPPGSL